MLSLLIGQAIAPAIVHWVVIGIILIGVAGIAFVVARAAGIEVPPWAIQIAWIVVLVVIAVVAIKFLETML